MKQAFLDLGNRVFNEDRVMLQAQQRIIDVDPSRRMVLFDVDKAPMLYRRLVEKLVREEAAAAAAA
jgi:vanillate O-demethylase monooxygenase subunit